MFFALILLNNPQFQHQIFCLRHSVIFRRFSSLFPWNVTIYSKNKMIFFLIILNVISSNIKRITIVSRKRIKILENTKFTILSWNDDPIFRGFQNECSIKCTYSKRQCHPEGNQINAVRKKKSTNE